jgi:hypothetical protein
MQLKPDEQFEKVAIAISNIPNPAERTARAMDLFGRSGAELIPLMQAIATQSNEIGIAFSRIGGPVGEQAIRKLDDLGDAAGAVGLAAQSLGAELLALAAPALISGLEGLQSFFGFLRYTIVGATDAVVALDEQIRELDDNADKYLAGSDGRRGLDYFDNRRTRQRLLEEQRRAMGLDTPPFNPNLPVTAAIDPLAGGGPAFDNSDEQEAAAKAARKRQEEKYAAELAADAEMRLKMDEMTRRALEEDKRLKREALDDQLDYERRHVEEKIRIHSEAETFLARVREVFNIKAIDLEEIKNKSIFGLTMELFSDLAGANTKFAKLQQGIAIAQTVWYTAAGIMNAFRTLPWPASLLAAGKVALTGAVQVAKIKATNYTGGGGSAPSVAGGSSVSAAADSGQGQNIPEPEVRGGTNVYITGMITSSVVDQLVEGLREGFNRDVVIIPAGSRQAVEIRGSA